MAKDSKQRRQKQREREHERLKATFDEFHRKGVYIKRVYRQRGVDLPFYDYYDSYYDEFARVVSQAKAAYRSLMDVVELEDRDYFEADRSALAPGMDQIFWHTEQEQNGYGTGSGSDESNINGYTNAFRDRDGRVRTLVVIRKSIPNSKPHREFKYILKLVALLHELGHVHDMEQQINFDHAAKTFDVIEAEVFAHLYSLRRMAEQNYYQCYTMLVDALKRYTTATNYLRDVATLTLERMPDYRLIDVNSVPLEPLTQADLRALGPDGRRAFGLAC